MQNRKPFSFPSPKLHCHVHTCWISATIKKPRDIPQLLSDRRSGKLSQRDYITLLEQQPFPLLICFSTVDMLFLYLQKTLPQFVKFVKFLFYGTIKYLSCSHLKVKSEREKDNRCLLIGLMYTRFWNYTPTSKEHLSADNNLCNSTKMTNSRRLGRWIIPVTDCKVNRLKLSRYILHFPINQKVSFFFSFFSKCSFHLYEGLNQNRNCMMLLKKGNNSKQRACNKNGSHQQVSGAFRIPWEKKNLLENRWLNVWNSNIGTKTKEEGGMSYNVEYFCCSSQ